ncbi:hypothetical protein G9A89_010243 [Geosiphon pyriformis]|nr:hypothetical protein G9A89_010243 [Geosiphon pyriformis]
MLSVTIHLLKYFLIALVIFLICGQGKFNIKEIITQDQFTGNANSSSVESFPKPTFKNTTVNSANFYCKQSKFLRPNKNRQNGSRTSASCFQNDSLFVKNHFTNRGVVKRISIDGNTEKLNDKMVKIGKRNVIKKFFLKMEGKIAIEDKSLLAYFKEMAQFAQKVYCLQVENMEKLLIVGARITQNRIIISMRGEEIKKIAHSFWDYHSTFTSYGETSKSGLVNFKWFEKFRQVEETLIHWFRDFKKINNLQDDKISSIEFTGHGLGGVYAMFFALRVKNQHPSTTIKIITFGASRPGNQDFALYIAHKIPFLYRITNFDDFAPHLPSATKLPYRHPNTEYWIYKLENCDCTEKKLRKPAFNVYKCLSSGRNDIENEFFYIEENQFCHYSTLRDEPQQPERSHLGPYFSVMMNCNLENTVLPTLKKKGLLFLDI